MVSCNVICYYVMSYDVICMMSSDVMMSCDNMSYDDIAMMSCLVMSFL